MKALFLSHTVIVLLMVLGFLCFGLNMYLMEVWGLAENGWIVFTGYGFIGASILLELIRYVVKKTL
jgi:hypothetical protein